MPPEGRYRPVDLGSIGCNLVKKTFNQEEKEKTSLLIKISKLFVGFDGEINLNDALA
ncbi:MAG: hypothetical protein R6V40_01625 [Candidatus Moraniibacteriota bacterium]